MKSERASKKRAEWHSKSSYQALKLLLEYFVFENLAKGRFVGAVGLLVSKAKHALDEQLYVVVGIVGHVDVGGKRGLAKRSATGLSLSLGRQSLCAP